MWKTVLISILVIIIAQYLFQYLKDTLTPRKTKDLVGFQKQKFEEIINELREAKNSQSSATDMEAELLDFARIQLEENNSIVEVI